MAFLSEAQLESALLEQLAGWGYACASDDIAIRLRTLASQIGISLDGAGFNRK